jgi:membrane protein implicated in regulation of membrane protease activity
MDSFPRPWDAWGMSAWELWIAAALLLAGSELFHGALVLLPLGLACLFGAAAAALGAGPAGQVLAFALAAVAEFLLARPVVLKHRRGRHVGNAEAIVGKRVKVLQQVSEKSDGVVLLTGEHWKARALKGSLEPGTEGQVIERDGLRLLIVPYDE